MMAPLVILDWNLPLSLCGSGRIVSRLSSCGKAAPAAIGVKYRADVFSQRIFWYDRYRHWSVGMPSAHLQPLLEDRENELKQIVPVGFFL
jgi:hypothetical protein